MILKNYKNYSFYFFVTLILVFVFGWKYHFDGLPVPFGTVKPEEFKKPTITPESVEISPNASTLSTIKIKNNNDIPIYAVQIGLILSKGDLNLGEIKIEPRGGWKNKYPEFNGLIGKNESNEKFRMLFIKDIDPKQTLTYELEFPKSENNINGLIKLKVLNYKKEPAKEFLMQIEGNDLPNLLKI